MSPPSMFTFEYDANSGSSFTSQSGGSIARSTISIVIQIGAAAMLLGAYLIAKRFSLRWMIAGVLGVALLSSYPFIRLDGTENSTHSIRVISPTMLTESRVTGIRAALQPAMAMETLPKAFLDELNLKPGEGVPRVRVSQNGGEIKCDVVFAETVSEDQRRALENFYEEYAILLVCRKLPNGLWSAPSPWQAHQTQWETERKLALGIP